MNKGKSSQESSTDTWFQVLRSAHKSGDRTLESLARRELEKLGYRVRPVKENPSVEATQ
jgi:hypothetical protein